MDFKGILKNFSKNMLNEEFSRRTQFTKNYKKNRVKNNVVFYESFHGKAMNDNPFAIFKYLVNKKEYSHLIHVWALNDTTDNEYVKHYDKLKNVKFVTPYTKDYYYYLTVAKYVFHNVTLPPYYIKNDEQIYINTWHGTPLKTLGKEMAGNVAQNYNVQRNFLQSDFLLSPNSFTTEKMIYSYDIDGIYKGKVLENGYPRIDSIFNESKVVKDFLEKNGIDLNKELVLYAPTWRGITGRVQDTTTDMIERLNTISQGLSKSNKQFIVKVHPLVYQFMKDAPLDNVLLVPDWVDANELLHFVDVLITDYSSIFFDFLVTDKPILFYMYDKEEYEQSRGLYFDLNEMPGEICLTTDKLITFILNAGKENVQSNPIVNIFKKKYIPHEDGHVTERYMDFILDGKQTVDTLSFDNHKPNVVVYGGGLLNNGITSSLINLSKNFDYEKYNLIVIDKNKVNQEFEGNIGRLSNKAHVIYRNNGLSLTYSEWIKYNRLFNRSVVEDIKTHQFFVAREWKRLLGETRVDVAIDFGGYAPFWSYMMAFSTAKRKIIYQHNDMQAEFEKVVDGRYVHKKNLTTIFEFYKYFDYVASVGRLTMEQNKNNLQNFVSSEKFVYVPNLLDKEYLFDHRKNPQLSIKEVLGEEKLIIEESSEFGRNMLVGVTAPTKNAKNFVTIGRLSPEKDQEKLLFAFKEIMMNTKLQHQLYIIGSGKDEKKLKTTTYVLGLEKNVIFVGQTSNAMEMLDKCDLFVFPSNHEGQPMTLLECLALQIPVVATNIPGNISVLGDKNGLIVENNVDGLVGGINRYLAGEKIPSSLNVDEYNKDALNRFYALIE
ncbi:CDP-glycerol glycerophosphotransferase family protein [Enterococcus gallinarum]|uniref:glycosyltransferase n=1 Tax=Enterococcus gallinarum TaxID=1353 RepID=UPI001558406E|nr:glycosyltransferase [Enterococcus gallinarum]NQE02833.1 glycosyltransferase [Enterococcus gallinarum]